MALPPPRIIRTQQGHDEYIAELRRYCHRRSPVFLFSPSKAPPAFPYYAMPVPLAGEVRVIYFTKALAGELLGAQPKPLQPHTLADCRKAVREAEAADETV